MNDAPGPIDISPSPNAALVLDSQLRIVAVSDAYLQSRQTDRPALLGHEIRELLPDQPESELARRAALNMMEDAVAARQHAEAVNAQLQAEIAERRRAEAIVQESENYLRRFVERAPAAIAMLDRDLRYICASHRWLQDYRLGNQLISGRGHDEVFPQLPPHWRDVYRRCLGGAIEKGEEDMFPRPDGTVDWIRWEVVPWTDGDGNVGGNIARFINHACKPNCWFEVVDKTVWIRASRTIREDEEITFDYSIDGEKTIPCRCRSGCKNMI